MKNPANDNQGKPKRLVDESREKNMPGGRGFPDDSKRQNIHSPKYPDTQSSGKQSSKKNSMADES
jgi:hypothetical protein